MPDTTQSIPEHVGLILDGNRRWAKQRGLTSLEGHAAGYQSLREVIRAAFKHGVSYVSVFAFSTENWKRAPEEVGYLLDLAYLKIKKDLRELQKENVRVLWLGSTEHVSVKLQKAIRGAVEKTKDNTGGTLAFCFNYGGQQEIVDAARNLVGSGVKPEDVTQAVFERFLYEPEVPQVDLLIRSSGEQRLSGFMLYRMAYAELYFIDKFWPDFTPSDLEDALAEYNHRERRIGR